MNTRRWLAGLALVAVGCAGPTATDLTSELQEQALPLPARRHLSVEWVGEDWFVVGLAGELGEGAPARLFRVRVEGSGWGEVTPPADPECTARTLFLALGESWDGRVVVHHRCLGATATVPGRLGALDVESGDWDVLVDDVGSMALASASFHPDMGEGLVSFNTDVCVGMARVTATGFAELPVVLGEGEDAWRVDDDFFAPRDCEGGRAFAPQWSPDGGRVAFLASQPGGRGRARLDAPWQVWVMDAGRWTPQLLVEGFHHVGGLRWSPDGRWLSLVAQDRRSDGLDRRLFVYDTHDGELYALTEGGLVEAIWSPEGTRIVVSRYANLEDPPGSGRPSSSCLTSTRLLGSNTLQGVQPP